MHASSGDVGGARGGSLGFKECITSLDEVGGLPACLLCGVCVHVWRGLCVWLCVCRLVSQE